MGDIGMRLDGDEELFRRLEKIGNPSTQRRIARKAVRAGAGPLRKAAKAQLGSHTKTGRLKRSISTKVKVYLSGAVVAITGNDAKIAPHGHLVEFGTVERFHKGGLFLLGKGKSTGKAPPIGFFRRAFAASASASESKMIAKLRTELGKL